MKLICVILLLGQLSTLWGDGAKKKEFFSQPLDKFTATVLLQGAGDANNLNHASSCLKKYMEINSVTEKSVREQLHSLVTLDKTNFLNLMKNQKGIKEWTYDVVRAQAVYVLGELGDKSSIQVLEEYMNQINLTGEKHTDVYVSILKVSDFDRKYMLNYLQVDEGRLTSTIFTHLLVAYADTLTSKDLERMNRLGALINEIYHMNDRYKKWFDTEDCYTVPWNMITDKNTVVDTKKDIEKVVNDTGVSGQEEKEERKPAETFENAQTSQRPVVEKADGHSWLIYLLAILGIAVALGLIKGKKTTMKVIYIVLLLGQLSTVLGDEAKKKEFFSQPLDEFTATVLLQGAGDAHNLNHASSRLKNYMAVNSITEKKP